ncbi:Neuronal acetylcholine receptor subunit alpha-3, partial [Cichlidogyrus casuarinus]
MIQLSSADFNNHGFLAHDFVTVTAEGEVMWFVSAMLKTTCRVDISMFPFDEQICEMQFGSWLHSKDELEYVFLPIGESYDKVNLTGCDQARMVNRALNVSYYRDTDWNLTNATVHYEARSTDHFAAWEAGSGSGMSSPEDQRFQRQDIVTGQMITIPDQRDFVLRIRIKRRSLYYIWNIIVPCVMLSVLTIVTFMTPVESGEKIQLGLSVFLAFSMFMMLISKCIPPTAEEIPII